MICLLSLYAEGLFSFSLWWIVYQKLKVWFYVVFLVTLHLRELKVMWKKDNCCKEFYFFSEMCRTVGSTSISSEVHGTTVPHRFQRCKYSNVVYHLWEYSTSVLREGRVNISSVFLDWQNCINISKPFIWNVNLCPSRLVLLWYCKDKHSIFLTVPSSSNMECRSSGRMIIPVSYQNSSHYSPGCPQPSIIFQCRILP